jgi:K+-sensing histidine kinase KdpD
MLALTQLIPVTGIAMLARLALRKASELSDSSRRHFTQIKRTRREMMRLIQNLLEIAEIEEGKLPLAIEPVALTDVVRGSTEVRIEALAEAGCVTLRVIDDGRGIAIEDQACIFEKFGTIRRSPSSEPSRDTGLGLPFCKLAVERIGGSIRLTSQAGGPTVFAVTLPPSVSS